MAPYPTGRLALIFTDLEGSSQLSEQHGAAFERWRDEHFRLLRAVVARWNGFEVETAGDSLFVVFASAADALQCAVEAQRAMQEYAWPPAIGALRVRIGIHAGEPFVGLDGNRPTYRGPVTNRAARVQAAGHGGQVLLSQAAYEWAGKSLPLQDAATVAACENAPCDISLRDLGRHRLKGVGEEHLWQACHPQLPADFAPLNTLDALLHTLPAPAGPFLGHDDEIAAWRDLLGRSEVRLLTLTGFGGMGKTRAALHLAEMVVGAMEGGVWWIELDEARTGPEMMERLALALPLTPSLEGDPTTRVRDWAREREALLVLDNLEQITDAASFVGALVRDCPRLKCLATSRSALGVRAEHVVEVPPLSLEAAARLFAARVAQNGVHVAEDDEDVLELCRRLEGVPLAIELAAARATHLAPRELLERLRERFRLLRSSAPDLPPRQRALRGAIDWSYDLLDPAPRRVFAHLSVFAGGFTLQAAEAVCAEVENTEDETDVWDAVELLQRRSLLRAEIGVGGAPTRFSMLESVQEYAAEKLEVASTAQTERDVLHDAHARFFARQGRAAVAHVRGAREAESLRQLERDLDNLHTGAAWSAAQTGAEQIVTGAELCLTLCIFYGRRGLLREALDWNADGVRRMQAALEVTRSENEQLLALEAALERERAGLLLDAWRWNEAEAVCRGARERFVRLGDRHALAELANLEGLIALGKGGEVVDDASGEVPQTSNVETQLQEAHASFKQAAELFAQVADAIGVATAQHNLGMVAWQRGELEAAEAHWNEALRGRRAHDDQRGTAETLNNLGMLAQERGHLELGWRAYEEALNIERELCHLFGIARALTNLGELALLNHKFERAHRLLAAGEALFDRVGSPYVAYCREQIEAVEQLSNATLAAPPGLATLPLEKVVAWAMEEAAG